MNKRNVPVIQVVVQTFVSEAEHTARALKVPDLPMVTVPYPGFAQLPEEKLRSIAEELFPKIEEFIAGRKAAVRTRG